MLKFYTIHIYLVGGVAMRDTNITIRAGTTTPKNKRPKIRAPKPHSKKRPKGDLCLLVPKEIKILSVNKLNISIELSSGFIKLNFFDLLKE